MTYFQNELRERTFIVRRSVLMIEQEQKIFNFFSDGFSWDTNFQLLLSLVNFVLKKSWNQKCCANISSKHFLFHEIFLHTWVRFSFARNFKHVNNIQPYLHNSSNVFIFHSHGFQIFSGFVRIYRKKLSSLVVVPQKIFFGVL